MRGSEGGHVVRFKRGDLLNAQNVNLPRRECRSLAGAQCCYLRCVKTKAGLVEAQCGNRGGTQYRNLAGGQCGGLVTAQCSNLTGLQCRQIAIFKRIQLAAIKRS